MTLVVIHAVQRLRHYIPFRKTTIIVDVNPFQHILSQQIVGRKYNKWIVILQEFYHGFAFDKFKKSLAFSNIMSQLTREDKVSIESDYFPNKHIFLIQSDDPWYGNIIIYLQNQRVPPQSSTGETHKIHHQS